MNRPSETCCTAFEGFRRIASGSVAEVALKTKEVIDRGATAPVLIFDDATARPVEIDFRGTPDDVLRRLSATAGEPMAAAPVPTAGQGAAAACVPADSGVTQKDATSAPPSAKPSRGVGRPRLGVVAREVTLLPRHWQWLGAQPGGASVALRKLVEQARRANEARDRIRLAQEAANRFMSAMAGNLPGFEEATRALFARNRDRFNELVEPWPSDAREYAKQLAAPAMAGREEPCHVDAET